MLFLKNKFFHLLAVLLLLVSTSFLGLVGANQPVLVTDLSGLLLAVLGLSILLGLLGTSFHLHLVDLLRFGMAILLFNGEREGI